MAHSQNFIHLTHLVSPVSSYQAFAHHLLRALALLGSESLLPTVDPYFPLFLYFIFFTPLLISPFKVWQYKDITQEDWLQVPASGASGSRETSLAIVR
jgi:hypothetical protein